LQLPYQVFGEKVLLQTLSKNTFHAPIIELGVLPNNIKYLEIRYRFQLLDWLSFDLYLNGANSCKVLKAPLSGGCQSLSKASDAQYLQTER